MQIQIANDWLKHIIISPIQNQGKRIYGMIIVSFGLTTEQLIESVFN